MNDSEREKRRAHSGKEWRLRTKRVNIFSSFHFEWRRLEEDSVFVLAVMRMGIDRLWLLLGRENAGAGKPRVVSRSFAVKFPDNFNESVVKGRP